MNICPKQHGNPSSSDPDISLKAKNVNLLKALEDQSTVFIHSFLWGSQMSHRIQYNQLELIQSGLQPTSQQVSAIICSLTIDRLHCDHIEPLFRFWLFILSRKDCIHFRVTGITVPSLPKLVISVTRSSLPLGLASGLKVRQAVKPSRKPLSRDCWHLDMTHKHSCNPPHLKTFVIQRQRSNTGGERWVGVVQGTVILY